MTDPFVWFDLRSKDSGASRSFYEQLLGWDVSEILVGESTVPMIGGERPWASIVVEGDGRPGWFPYVQVDDLDATTKKATELGATALV